MLKNNLIFLVLFFISFAAYPKTFRNAYVSFEMEDNWKCNLEQTEWVCRADDPQEAKEAVIILTAKEKGPTDSFPIYESHLNTSIQTVPRAGVIMNSIVKYKAAYKKINDHPWLDGLHQDSEVQNYFTRYMATIKEQIGILVTFSAHNRMYAKHSAAFDKAIRSLRVVSTKDLNRALAADTLRFGTEKYGTDLTSRSGISEDIERSPASIASAKEKRKIIGFGLLAIAFAVFVISKLFGKRKI